MTGVGIFGLIYLTPLFLGHVRRFIAWQIGGAILWAAPFRVGVLRNLDVAVHADHESMGWEEMLLPFAFRRIAPLRDCVDGHVDDGQLAS